MSESSPEAAPNVTALRELGRGRLGTVLLCTDDAGVEIAVRVLDVEISGDDAQRELVAELRAAAVLAEHRCAVRIHQVWVHERVGTCLTQDYCPGGSVADRLGHGRRLGAAEVTIGGVRLVAALTASHRAGGVHGDVRPANVFFDDAGDWLLADGGLAPAVGRARPGSPPCFDPSYAPGDRGDAAEPGPADDVYSLGATLHALLAGSAPSAVLPPTVPPVLATLVAAMMAADRADRPGLAEVDQALRALVPEARRAALPDPEPPGTFVPAARIARPEIAAVATADVAPDDVDTAEAEKIVVHTAQFAAVGVDSAAAEPAKDTDDTDDEAAAEPTGRRRRVLIAAAAATVLIAGASTGAVVATQGDDRPAQKVAAPGSPLDRAVTAGLVPQRLAAFVYKGRLAVTWVMTSFAADLTAFEVASLTKAGADRRPGRIQQQGLAAVGGGTSRTFVYFFERKVAPTRCVNVQPRYSSQRVLTDQRIRCPAVISPADKRVVDQAWLAYKKQQAATAATIPKASSAPKAPSATRPPTAQPTPS